MNNIMSKCINLIEGLCGRRNTLATVDIHHVAGQFVVICAMEKPSGYYLDLKADSKKRYQTKVTSVGLRIDPYSITQWSEDPCHDLE